MNPDLLEALRKHLAGTFKPDATRQSPVGTPVETNPLAWLGDFVPQGSPARQVLKDRMANLAAPAPKWNDPAAFTSMQSAVEGSISPMAEGEGALGKWAAKQGKPVDMLEKWLGGAGKAPSRGLEAWHATPSEVKFDKFDIDHMGSGEGAQVFSPGHYFGEEVAKPGRHYDKSFTEGKLGDRLYAEQELRNQNPFRQGGDGFAPYVRPPSPLDKPKLNERDWRILDNIRTKKMDPERAGRLEAQEEFSNGETVFDWEKRAHDLDKARAQLLKVNLDVDPRELVDWDKPIREQPGFVRDALGDHLQRPRRIWSSSNSFDPVDFEHLIDHHLTAGNSGLGWDPDVGLARDELRRGLIYGHGGGYDANGDLIKNPRVPFIDERLVNSDIPHEELMELLKRNLLETAESFRYTNSQWAKRVLSGVPDVQNHLPASLREPQRIMDQAVQGILNDPRIAGGSRVIQEPLRGDGSDLVWNIVGRHGVAGIDGIDKSAARAFANEMKNRGVPGMRFKDAASRHLPNNDPMVTRNYVMYDPDRITIKDRLSLAATAGLGGLAGLGKMMGGSQEPDEP